MVMNTPWAFLRPDLSEVSGPCKCSRSAFASVKDFPLLSCIGYVEMFNELCGNLNLCAVG